MGIRFHCPQGHKLNVKSFLAGKKGICPHCGVMVDIPTESTRKSSKELKTERAGGGNQATGAAPVAQPVAVPLANAPTATPAPVATPAQNSIDAQL